MRSQQRLARGFTLIDLLVTLVIGGILMMTAVPAHTTFKRNAGKRLAVAS